VTKLILKNHGSQSNSTKQRHRQITQTKNQKKGKTMTSLEELSTQFQKHNSKKRVNETASQCLRHLVSIGRKGDPVGDKIDLKKPRHHKHSSKHTNKDTGKEQKTQKQ
jgi:hypothetical protein